MNDRQWFVSQYDFGYDSIPQAAYPNRLLAEASAYLANKSGYYREYFATSIPLLTTLPRIERAQRLTVLLAEDGDRIVTDDQVITVAHFDPDEADEAPVIRIDHTRSWWSPPDIPRAAIRITAYGTDIDLVRESVAAREKWMRENWLPNIWTATYDNVATTGPGRRCTREFDGGDSAPVLRWLAERWEPGEIGPVEIRHWPTGERLAGNKLDRALASVAGQ